MFDCLRCAKSNWLSSYSACDLFGYGQCTCTGNADLIVSHCDWFFPISQGARTILDPVIATTQLPTFEEVGTCVAVAAVGTSLAFVTIWVVKCPADILSEWEFV